MIELGIQGIVSNDSKRESSALLLQEKTGDRKLLIIIGSNEAQSIYSALKRIIPPRPFIHDIFKIFTENDSGFVENILIHKFQNGVYYSNISYIKRDGSHLLIDSRPSDAIALAVRFNVPIYCTESIMDQLAIDVAFDSMHNDFESVTQLTNESATEKTDSSAKTSVIDTMTIKELEEKIKEAINEENYQLAAVYRDERNKRKKQDK